MNRPDIFSYKSFRDFFNQMFLYQKSVDKDFSYRKFSKKAGFSSSSVLKQIIDGKSGLSPEGAHKAAKGFDLSSAEEKFLVKFVAWEQSESPEQRRSLYEEMLADQNYSQRHPLAPAQFRFYDRWYYPLIRESVVMGARRLSEIREGLIHPLTKSEIQSALDDLVSLGLLKKENDEYFEFTRLVETEASLDIPSDLARFHKQMIQLGQDSIQNTPREQREIRSATLSVDASLVPELKAHLQEVIVQVLKKFEERSASPDRVYQLNLQAFPLAKKMNS